MDDLRGLVEAAARRDERAWREIVRRFEKLVWHMARLEGLDEATAADAVQNTWLRLVQHLRELREPERLGSWLAVTARREASRLRADRRRVQPLEPWDFDEEPADEQPDAQVLESERSRTLWAALGRLEEDCQALLRLVICDTSYRDISIALDWPIGSIGPNRRRCLDQLRRDGGIASIVR